MTRITHHPGEDILLEHYHGRLSEGAGLVVETHMAMCAHCRSLTPMFDAIGGAMIENVAGVAMSDEALDLAMARIERPFEPEAVPARKTNGRKPFLEGFALPEFVAKRIRSRYWAAPGVWIAPIRTGGPSSSKTYLLGVARNMIMPDHDHNAVEMTLVMQGGFSDANGDYSVGDFIEKAPGEPHSPATGDDEGCVSLISHDRPIRPLTWLGRLMKPLARI